MTFDPLEPDFADYPSYSEDGISFSAVDADEFFRADGVVGDTAAALFQSDGDPLEIAYGGKAFHLYGIDFEEFAGDTVALLTSSSGDSFTVNATGTFAPPSGFRGVTWVRLSFEPSTAADPYYLVDNIVVGPVPEGGLSLGFLSLLAGLAAAGRSRSKAQASL